jgi:AraC-like DNA-binding protein
VLKTVIDHANALRPIAMARGRTGLHAIPTSVGIELRTSPDYSWDGLRRGNASFVVVQHTLSGVGQLEYEGRRFSLPPGTTMLVRIPHEHRYFVALGTSWRFFFLVLAGREVLYLADEIMRAVGPAIALGAPYNDELADICLRLLDASELRAGRASALAYEAMAVLLDGVSAGTPEDEDDWLAAVLDHISGNLERPLPIERLADLSGKSRAHFVRQFTRITGSAPSEHIFRQRMQRAAHLLDVSEHSVLEIARLCGFRNANYFAKAFRRAFEISPSEFRASGMYSMPVGGQAGRPPSLGGGS